MSDNEILSESNEDLLARCAEWLEWSKTTSSLCRDHEAEALIAVLAASHEALRAERDLFRSIAERHAGGWHRDFPADETKAMWHPWNDGEPEPLTAAEIEWYRQRREARQ